MIYMVLDKGSVTGQGEPLHNGPVHNAVSPRAQGEVVTQKLCAEIDAFRRSNEALRASLVKRVTGTALSSDGEEVDKGAGGGVDATGQHRVRYVVL